jgi:hypothetical protein
MADSREHYNEPLGSIQSRQFLDHINDCQFLKEDSVVP